MKVMRGFQYRWRSVTRTNEELFQRSVIVGIVSA
jgi:hypothetical protein